MEGRGRKASEGHVTDRAEQAEGGREVQVGPARDGKGCGVVQVVRGEGLLAEHQRLAGVVAVALGVFGGRAGRGFAAFHTLLEVTDAAIDVWGAGRVGVHLSPRADLHDMGDENLAETFGYVARELGKRGIAFICSREAEGPDSIGPQLKEAFGGPYIVNEGFTKDSANAWLAAGKADAVAFGVPFIANPDLPARLKVDAPLNEAHPETFYSKGAVGYIDYPAL